MTQEQWSHWEQLGTMLNKNVVKIGKDIVWTDIYSGCPTTTTTTNKSSIYISDNKEQWLRSSDESWRENSFNLMRKAIVTCLKVRLVISWWLTLSGKNLVQTTILWQCTDVHVSALNEQQQQLWALPRLKASSVVSLRGQQPNHVWVRNDNRECSTQNSSKK